MIICKERSALWTPPCISSWSLELEGILFAISPKQEAGHSPMWITVSMSLCFPVTWIIIWCKHYMLSIVKSSQICLPGIHLIRWNIWHNHFPLEYGMQCEFFFQKLEVFLFCSLCYLASVLMNVGLHHITLVLDGASQFNPLCNAGDRTIM